jgi:hypothetical protein
MNFGASVRSQPWFLPDLFEFIILPFDTKGKAIPLQAWTGLEGSRRLRLPDFSTIGT